MQASVFVGTSLDGFLARPDGAIDFLPADGGGESTGFEEFFDSVDCLVMGRKTFETALGFPSWPYGDKRLVVLSSKALDKRAPKGVQHMAGEPAEILARLEREGVKHVNVDGGQTIQAFLRAGLVDRIVVTRLPVLIGQGIPLFGPLDGDVQLRHVSTKTLAAGLVQSEYAVFRVAPMASKS